MHPFDDSFKSNCSGISQEERDMIFMKKAIAEAKKAYDEDEVPVGAVMVLNNRVIAKGRNQVEKLKDATAHAEILCITAASAELDNWRLLDTTLYCTLEPCLMCAGAIIASRVSRVVWGAPDVRLGANGSLIDVFDQKHPFHNVEITQNILKDECSMLLKRFFQNQRLKKESLKREN
ncbi:MAG TPA: tRNA adenosine(34) deaminase TadA [Chlamydiales bacterium]|nr:tRNA adenosine(34) deaminase TadA [Chlamydiales bacterium]